MSSRVRDLAIKYPDLVVQDQFINRAEEIEFFDQAIQRISRDPASGTGSNVLCFYGPGGLGKSALSSRLQERFIAGSYPQAAEHRASARISFEDRGAVDWERTLLEVRSSLAQTLESFPAFDLAMLRYLETRHGNRDSARGSSAGLLTRGSKLDLPDELSSIVSDLITALEAASLGAAIGLANPVAAVGGVLIRLAKVVAPTFRARQLKRLEQRLKDDCAPFSHVHNAIFQESPVASKLIHTPSLLAWDISQHESSKKCDVAIFIDGWERAQNLGLSLYSPTDFVSSMAAQMPNTLFVITGRIPLNWSDPAASHLHSCGPSTWPDLTNNPKKQIGLGSLRRSDAVQYVGCFRIKDEPVLDDSLSTQLAKTSEGIPLAVEFGIAKALRLRHEGVQLTAAHFKTPPRELLGHLIDSMSREEKRLLVVAAIAGMFDRDLLREVGNTHEGAIDGLLSAGLVETEPIAQLQNRLHTWVRDAIYAPDSVVGTSQDAEDWNPIADKVMKVFAQRLEADLADYPRGDENLMARIAFLAWDVVSRHGVVQDWLVDLRNALWVRGRREAHDYPRYLVFPPETGAELLGLACGAHPDLAIDERLARLADSNKRSELPPRAASYVQLQEAIIRFQHSRYQTSRQLFEEIAEEGSPFTETATNHIALIDMYSGRFDRVQQWADNFVPRRPEEEAWPLGRLARLYMYNARFSEAERELEIKEKVSDAISSPLYLARADHLRAEIFCWSRPEAGVSAAERALRANREADNSYGVAYSIAARAICHVQLDPTVDIRTDLRESLAIFDGLPSKFHALFPLVGEAYAGSVKKDLKLLDNAKEELKARATSLGVGEFWVEIVNKWRSEIDPDFDMPHPFDVSWLDPEALERWGQLAQIS